jgi:hypothetical protein
MLVSNEPSVNPVAERLQTNLIGRSSVQYFPLYQRINQYLAIRFSHHLIQEFGVQMNVAPVVDHVLRYSPQDKVDKVSAIIEPIVKFRVHYFPEVHCFGMTKAKFLWSGGSCRRPFCAYHT